MLTKQLVIDILAFPVKSLVNALDLGSTHRATVVKVMKAQHVPILVDTVLAAYFFRDASLG